MSTTAARRAEVRDLRRCTALGADIVLLPRGLLLPRISAFKLVHAFGSPPDDEPPPDPSVMAIGQGQSPPRPSTS